MQKVALVLLVLAFAGCSWFDDEVFDKPHPTSLTAERRSEQQGIDTAQPRLGWNACFTNQTAYQIQCASSRIKLLGGEADLWDSGKITSSQCVDVLYAGKPLATSQRVFWRVKIWDAADVESAWSSIATWLCGVMRTEDWRAKWIGPTAITRPNTDFNGAEWIESNRDKQLEFQFVVASAALKGWADLRMASTGIMDVKLNGKQFYKHTGHIFDWRFVKHRNAEGFLVAGTNLLTVSIKRDGMTFPTPLPNVNAFIASLELENGSVPFITTPCEGMRSFGKVRESEWGKQMVLREEINSPAFRRRFTVRDGLVSAVLHITGLGFYEATLNGTKIGDKVLDPSPTAYDKHILYSTYDITDRLRLGDNVLDVLVGHGWYDVRAYATWNFDNASWRDFPRMIAQLELTYADGAREWVVSDKSWRQVASPIGFDCIREGEVIGCHDKRAIDLHEQVVMAEEVPAPRGKLVAEQHPGAKVIRVLQPEAIHKVGYGEYLFVFPENIAGWMRLNLHGQKKGDVVTMRYDEMADENGTKPAADRLIDRHFRYTASHRVCNDKNAMQTDHIICTGFDETYEPRFTYNGFRYVYVNGLRNEPRVGDAVACVVHTAFETAGTFESSNATLNELMRAADLAYRSNFADGYPTDCPHREKNGWTGDASIASELAQYCYENTATYEKWLRDVMDSQLANGDICCICPTGGWGFRWGNGPAWDSALPVIAWNLYVYRDDCAVLDLIYPSLKKYLAFTATKADAQGLVKHGLGDWIPVNHKHMPTTEFTSSCFYYQAQRIASLIAKVKGLKKETAQFAASAEKTRKGINQKYYKGKGVYDNGLQTAQSFAIAFGIVNKRERKAVEKQLIKSVAIANYHADFGLLGSKALFRALSNVGRTDLALKILLNPTDPSFTLFLREGGKGTALWEEWTNKTTSRNHIMFGDFVAWAYQYLAGIRLPETTGSCAAIQCVTARGFKDTLIAPQPVPDLDWVRASVRTPYGLVASSWRREATGRITYTVSVPMNATATLRLPSGVEHKLAAGTWSFNE